MSPASGKRNPFTWVQIALYEASTNLFFIPQMYSLVSQYRIANNLNWVDFSASLAQTARDSSVKMAASDFADVEGHGADLTARIDKYSPPGSWSMAGEAICCRHEGAPDPSGTDTPEKVMAIWKGSPGHNALLLNPAYTHAGVGRAVSKATRLNYWTLVLARVASAGPLVAYDSSTQYPGSNRR